MQLKVMPCNMGPRQARKTTMATGVVAGGLAMCWFFASGLAHAASTPSSPKVDPALCRALTRYTPDANVAYQPGVDAEGKAVAPADLPGSPQLKMPDKIKIPLTIGLAQGLNLNTSQYPYNQLGAGTEATLGIITVEGNNVSLDGKPLSDDQQDKLAVLCLQPR